MENQNFNSGPSQSVHFSCSCADSTLWINSRYPQYVPRVFSLPKEDLLGIPGVAREKKGGKGGHPHCNRLPV